MLRVLVILSLTLQPFSLAQNNQDARYYRQQAVKAYQAKNYEECVEYLRKAIDLIPDHPTILYNLAAVCALLGRNEEALKALQTVARMGLYYRAEQDKDFQALREDASFKAILKQLDENRTPIVHSSQAFTLDEKGLIAEGLAFDSASERLFVSSVHKR